MLASFKLEASGFVYLVDDQGLVRLHTDTGLINKANLDALYGNGNVTRLLEKSDFNLAIVEMNNTKMLVVSSYIPSMNWYVVAQVPYNEIFATLDNAAWNV